MLTRRSRYCFLVAAIALGAWGCGSPTPAVQTAGPAPSLPQSPPMSPEQRAGSISYQMNTAVDALSKASDKLGELEKRKAEKDLSRIESLLYAAGETIGDYPNNPPTGKKGADLTAWTKQATSAANSALAQIQQAEQLTKDADLTADLRTADDALNGAVQTAKAE